MKVLITGGSGFIGTHLILHLLSQNEDIAITNVDLSQSPITDQRLTTLIGDIRSEQFIDQIESDNKFDSCIHLAALCKEPGYEWEEYFLTNHKGTNQVIALCERLDISEIIFTSTMMVYKAGEIQRMEGSVTSPDTAYGISKLLAEKELLAWRNGGKGRKLKIIRPAVVFGENENANFTRLYKSLRKGFFPYVGKSSTVKSSIYVKELVLFIEFLRSTDGELNIYNMSFPEDQTIRRTIQLFKEVFDIKAFNPVIPFKLLLLLSRGFEILNMLGLKNSIHHRRIEKLYYSTDIFPQNAKTIGYNFMYDFRAALEDWKVSGDPNVTLK